MTHEIYGLWDIFVLL